LIKDTDSLGIKFREGRFEIKQRLNIPGDQITSGKISGLAELWKKWSFESNENEIIPADLKKGEWIDVVKARKLQKFIFNHKGEIAGGFDNYKSDGCNIELTKVIANNSGWWTLGLETYGKTELLFKNLRTAFDHILNADFPQTLSKKKSCGYPEWLARVE